MVVDHIGIVVRSLEDGLRQWEDLFGYKRNSEVVLNTRQKVRVVFLSKPECLTVKLVEPAGVDSPVAAFAARGGGLHHLCFRCAQVAAEIPRLEKGGAKLLVAPQPGEAFENHDIAFLWAGNGLNVELIDTSAKKGWDLNH